MKDQPGAMARLRTPTRYRTPTLRRHCAGHAQAREVVHLPFDVHGVSTSLQGLGLPTLRLWCR